VRHIYVHVPFCARRCVYCDFAIAVRRSIPSERFAGAIERELRTRRAGGAWDEAPVETVYFGGGTPSLLAPQALADVLAQLKAGGGASFVGREVTLEANPDDVTEPVAATWVEAGVNRVSLGVQSFDQRILEWMHRTHSADATGRAVRILRAAGVANLSLDLIFGLPTHLHGDFARDVDRALELEPNHLSVYGLTVEPGTPLGRWVARGRTRPAHEAQYEREFLLADERLTAAGFEHYEVSNYARPGYRAGHNAAYWQGAAYTGLGPSAHSHTGHERSWNVRDWAQYEKTLLRGCDPTEGRELLTVEQQRLERLYLGLRTADGVDGALVKGGHRWEAALEQGWAEVKGGRARLTPAGWLRLDELVAGLTTFPDGG
jgi:oxygen-independent coproporphyrinogen-3 oxidase